MKKLRPPDSIEDAIVQACAVLGIGAIAVALDVSESMVTKWSDHDDPAHRIGLHQALLVERLLIRTGNGPIFGALFEREQPAVDGEAADPVSIAMRTTIDAANLMDGVAAAMKDGRLTPPELIGLRARTGKLQKAIAKFRRCLVFTSARPPPRQQRPRP